MGTPQVEDGYTRIANELLDALISFDFSKREQKIILYIIRKTYGFGKKMDDITLTQIANATGIHLAHVSKTVSELTHENVLLKRQGRYGFNLGINKDYREWKDLPKQQGVTETVTQPYQNSNLTLPKQQPQKKLPKENTKRKAAISLTSFLEQCKSSGQKPISDEDPIFEYAAKVGIDREMLVVCWQEFKAAHLQSGKTQADWRAHYRNAVRRNWYKLWFLKDGSIAQWTTQGEQARRAAA